MGEQIVYRTDEIENAIDYLEQAAKIFEDTENPHKFKWLMISLHGALYGFGVCAIKGTRSFYNVTKKIKDTSPKYKKKKAELEAIFSEYDFDFDLMTAANIAELITIWDVLKRCKTEEYMKQFTYSEVLQTDPTQEHAIEKLIQYRNHLAHFQPAVYGITGNYEKDIVMPVIEVINFLALKSNNVMYYNDEYKTRVEKAIQIFKVVI